MKLLRAAGIGIFAMIMLTACSSTHTQSAGPNTGFLSGDGSIQVIATAQRTAAPNFTVTTLTGQTFALSSQRGKVVVVNVWASWCAPCRAEAPLLEKTWNAQSGKPVAFLGLATRDTQTAATDFIHHFGITYPNALDEDGSTQLLFSATLPPEAIPSTLVIDPQGRIAARVLGRTDQATLQGLIDQAAAT
jgi:peroxiredoxin